MKKVIYLVILLSLFVLVSCGKKDQENVNNPSTQAQTDSSAEQIQETVIAEEDKVSQYRRYEGDLSEGTDEKILFFSSQNCNECLEAEKKFSQLKPGTSISDIIRVDIDNDPDMVERYAITEANSYVLIDEYGNIISSITGASSVEDLSQLYE
jgi:hypothetical protein